MQTDPENSNAQPGSLGESRAGSRAAGCSAMADSEAEQVAWEWFAGAHPHEAHAKWPDRFWEFFQSRRPGVTREKMARTLRETDESPNAPALRVSDGRPSGVAEGV